MVNALEEIDLKITKCYLCGIHLGLEDTPDHVIPDHLFDKDDPYRPKLKVHNKCNNLKSKDDEWFVKQLQLRCSFNPKAEKEFSKMIEKAISEKPDAYIIGKKLHNYKLMRGIFDKTVWGLELKYKGQGFLQVKFPRQDAERFQRYVETMCRGLFIRNVPFSEPLVPDLVYKQYVDLELKGKDMFFVNAIKTLIDDSKTSLFGQMWGDRVLYVGSRVVETPNKGFVFIQFYSQFGILAAFK